MTPALVMNLYYTGLGIARSLGERRIPVIGLSAQKRVYGNYTRYAHVRQCPDSRGEPERLLEFLLEMRSELEPGAVLFPTRDDDVIFLDRYRNQLDGFYRPVLPAADALLACLDKWETYRAALQSGTPVPRTWKIEDAATLARAAAEAEFPCVLKPVRAADWRKAGNWQRVGGRKAIPVANAAELSREYNAVAGAERRALLQEWVRGGDTDLLVAACHLDGKTGMASGFTAQKLAQAPPGYGTGYIVQTIDRLEVLESAIRLLKAMRFSGIAEVEFKWDSRSGQHRLIEVNPRPWDQHRLGNAVGTDVIYSAYCEHAGVVPAPRKPVYRAVKWIGEDVLLMTCARTAVKSPHQLIQLLAIARGRRIYAIWSWKDPIPFVVRLAGLAREILGSVARRVSRILARRSDGLVPEEGPL